MRILACIVVLFVLSGCNSAPQGQGSVVAGVNAPGGPQNPAAAIVAPTNVCTWDYVGWEDMSPAEQAAWEALGWSAELWNSDAAGAAPPTDAKEWGALTASERGAAQSLGFNQTNWDSDACKTR